MQVCNRQFAWTIDAGNPQDDDVAATGSGPGAQLLFSIQAPIGSIDLWLRRKTLVYPGALAVAVHACGADVDETRRLMGQRRDKAPQPLVGVAIGRARIEDGVIIR